MTMNQTERHASPNAQDKFVRECNSNICQLLDKAYKLLEKAKELQGGVNCSQLDDGLVQLRRSLERLHEYKKKYEIYIEKLQKYLKSRDSYIGECDECTRHLKGLSEQHQNWQSTIDAIDKEVKQPGHINVAIDDLIQKYEELNQKYIEFRARYNRSISLPKKDEYEKQKKDTFEYLNRLYGQSLDCRNSIASIQDEIIRFDHIVCTVDKLANIDIPKHINFPPLQKNNKCIGKVELYHSIVTDLQFSQMDYPGLSLKPSIVPVLWVSDRPNPEVHEDSEGNGWVISIGQQRYIRIRIKENMMETSWDEGITAEMIPLANALLFSIIPVVFAFEGVQITKCIQLLSPGSISIEEIVPEQTFKRKKRIRLLKHVATLRLTDPDIGKENLLADKLLENLICELECDISNFQGLIDIGVSDAESKPYIHIYQEGDSVTDIKGNKINLGLMNNEKESCDLLLFQYLPQESTDFSIT